MRGGGVLVVGCLIYWHELILVPAMTRVNPAVKVQHLSADSAVLPHELGDVHPADQVPS